MRHLWYNLKITFMNKDLIFWTFAFPIILGTFFYMAFSDIKAAEKYEPIKISVVENEKQPMYPVYKNVIDTLSEKDSADQVFETTFTADKDAAMAELNDHKVAGVVEFKDNDPSLIVKENGINQTIVQNVLTEIEQSIKIGKQLEPSEIRNTYEPKYEMTMIEYFSLLAMATLYGAMIVTKLLDKNLANMTASGKRIASAAISKAKIIGTVLLSSYITQLVGLTILFSYLTLVLKIDFGDNLLPIIGYTCLGALLGLSFGTFVSTVFKVNEDAKDGITTGITMLGSFFAGMMGPQMKYIIDANVPILNKLNPVAVITDGYYAIVNYGVGERFWIDVATILVFSAILSGVSIMILRRQKYDNL